MYPPATETRVGPKGYIHGWIKVNGVPQPLDKHPPHIEFMRTKDIGRLTSDLAPEKTVEERYQAKPRDETQKRLDAVIAKHGWHPSPLNVLNGERLIDGHHTYAAARERGVDVLPVLHFKRVKSSSTKTGYKTVPAHEVTAPARQWAEPVESRGPSWPDFGTLVARTAETPVASTVHEPFGSPSGPGLFHVKGLQLPAYVQHVAHHLVAQGHPESKAIQMAIGIVKNWAAGHDGHGNAIHPDVQAAAVKAVAEWEAAKAAAKGKG